ncbi:MAG: glycoside hydrolase domain-containing protein [Mangrovibacterium sp.]
MKIRIVGLIIILLSLDIGLYSQTKYTVPNEPWEEKYGNHRTVITIEKPADAVRLSYLWRRHDTDQESRHLMIFNETTGEKVKNLYRIKVSGEECDIVFGPVKQPGKYCFYYLPYEPVLNNYYAGSYWPKEDAPDEGWLQRNSLTGDQSTQDLSHLQQCQVEEIQARTEFHSFYPMEVIATKAEVSEYLDQWSNDYLVFPEDRSRPVRMSDALPAVWLQKGPSPEFRGVALRNEYYAFQLGVFASKVALKNVTIHFSGLDNAKGTKILPAQFTCFNTHGVDIDGNPFVVNVDVAKGKVQPMWIGIDVPSNIEPGEYTGFVSVAAENVKTKEIKVVLTIEDRLLTDRGDGEPWRHSRLRWLNSTIGINDEPVRPYTNIQVRDKLISLLGRDIVLNDYGFPSGITAWKNEILAAPVKFAFESDNRLQTLKPVQFTYTKKKNGIVAWEAVSENEALTLTCNGEIEFDGRMNYSCQVSAKKKIHLQDIRLELPYKKEMATYMIGMGRMGGFTPEFHKSRWIREEDSFWLGNTKGGIQCELRGGSYHGPLLNLYQPAHPEAWFNGVNGGFRIDTENGITTASAYSGYRPMSPGDHVTFEFALIITPVREYHANDQFNYRYVHTPNPDANTVNSGANVMNIHHANEFNPYINYPFIANDKLKGITDQWHAKGCKVKIYYTVRELSNHLTEIWALRSLGTEVLADGNGGGYQWLQEHLVNRYQPQWYTHLGDGVVDAAILNSGESRWYNYYLEGLAWLLKEIDIDGLYLDDFSYDRRILKRMRRIMEEIKPGECQIDVHSNNAFTRGPANQYLEIYPYIDRTWYGEGFNFDLMPEDFWLSEVSGVPFGVINELLLHRSINKGRGMIYAMVPRGDWGMWNLWKEFDITKSKMIGYWENNAPVRTNNNHVFVTSYVKDDAALLVIGNWLSEPVKVNLEIDWEKLGLKEREVHVRIPEIAGYQEEGSLQINNPVSVEAKGVKLIWISGPQSKKPVTE